MSLAKLHGPNTRDCGYIAKRLWVCGLGKGSVDANEVATLLSRQLKSCGFHVDKYVAVDKHQAGLITDMVWAGAFDSAAAAGAAMLEMPQSYARTRPLTKTKPKAKPGPKAKSKPKTKPRQKQSQSPRQRQSPSPKPSQIHGKSGNIAKEQSQCPRQKCTSDDPDMEDAKVMSFEDVCLMSYCCGSCTLQEYVLLCAFWHIARICFALCILAHLLCAFWHIARIARQLTFLMCI